MKSSSRHVFAVATLLSTIASWMLFACATSTSSSDDTIADGGSTDSGAIKPKDGGVLVDTGVTGKDGGIAVDAGPSKDAGVKDASSDASSCDSLVSRDAGAGVFCPFSTDGGAGAAFGNSTCAPGQVCFRAPVGGNFSMNTCQAAATDVDGGVNWECNGPSDCASKAGKSCCGLAKLEIDNTCATNAYVNPKFFRGTRCQASCNAANDEFTVCEATGECAGKTCNAFSRFGAILGACQ